MILAAAMLMIQQAPSVYSDEAGSKAALQIFRDACTEGHIAVPPDRGRILRDSELTDFADFIRWRATRGKTVVKFNYPRGTFLIFADYKHVQPKGIGRECIVVSRVLSLEDAVRGIVWTAPDLYPSRTWGGWAIDVPERGFRARAIVRSDRSMLLELGTYASVLKPTTSEARIK